MAFTETGAPAIAAHGLSRRYRGAMAVRGLDLNVPRGSVFGLLGPNGAGKTTTLKMLLGLVRQSSGTAEILGQPIGRSAARRRVGYLPELFRYQAWLSAKEVLMLHAALMRVEPKEREHEVTGVLQRVGLAARSHDLVSTFSKGMQQRLGLAAALIGDPCLVFLDEPTSALDPLGRRDVRELVLELKSQGVTIFLNSHLLSEMELCCDHIAMMRHGTVVAEGPLQDVLGQPEVRVRADVPKDAKGLHAFGPYELDGDTAVFHALQEPRIPDLVQALVLAGWRIKGVQVLRPTLEQRFLHWAGGDGP